MKHDPVPTALGFQQDDPPPQGNPATLQVTRPGANPIGQAMSVPCVRNGKMASVSMMLVGIVQNVKYTGLASPSDDVI